jgi:hypothetical protein
MTDRKNTDKLKNEGRTDKNKCALILAVSNEKMLQKPQEAPSNAALRMVQATDPKDHPRLHAPLTESLSEDRSIRNGASDFRLRQPIS